jgi:hypothetical protein
MAEARVEFGLRSKLGLELGIQLGGAPVLLALASRGRYREDVGEVQGRYRASRLSFWPSPLAGPVTCRWV